MRTTECGDRWVTDAQPGRVPPQRADPGSGAVPDALRFPAPSGYAEAPARPRSPRLHLRRPARAGRCRPTSTRCARPRVPRDELWFAYKQSEQPAQARGRRLARAGRPARLDRRPPPHDDRWLRRDHRGDEGARRSRRRGRLHAAAVVPLRDPRHRGRPRAGQGAGPPAELRPGPRRDRRRHHAAHPHRRRQHPEQPVGPHLPTRHAAPPSPTILDEASARHGRRIWIVSDEPYNRIVFDGGDFHSPAQFYRAHAGLLQLRQDAARSRPAASATSPSRRRLPEPPTLHARPST